MVEANPRVPKKGERVSTQNAAYVVIAVDHEHMTVDLKLRGATDRRLTAVPWGVLIFLENSGAE
jgi:hypothetical protein